MANITLKIDDELLEKARRLAGKKNTSINAIVRQRIAEFVEKDSGREAALKGLEDFYRKCSEHGVRIGNRSWNRDELHER